MQFICKICHKEINERPSRKRQYCSMLCYRKSRKGKLIVSPNIILCKVCRKPFVAKKWSVLNRGKKYCSKKCRVVSQIGKSPMQGKKHSKETIIKLSLSHKGKIGELASNWKGGVTRMHYGSDKVERIRFRMEMQKLVFERDNYTCQLCGSNKDLQVDHIQRWSEYVELRFSMDNCRTLCARCHYRITFGKPMPDNLKAWGHNLKHVIERSVMAYKL